VNRESGLQRLRDAEFDVLIVGGGATGLGCAVDAATRGYKAALIEARDFAHATSSRSTKLVHGGVRYLQQGNIALVREALAERARLLANAPQLVRKLPFVVPAYSWWDLPYYAAGLRLYDALSRGSEFSGSRALSAGGVRTALPSVRADRLRGGMLYWDAQFDDARLAIALAQSAVDAGAAVANYVRATTLRYRNGRIAGVKALDEETGEVFEIRARSTINAAGIFADNLRGLDAPGTTPLLTFSRGSHIVVCAEALDLNETALLVPRTDDGRVLFAIPWHGSALIGTTEIAVTAAEDDPQPSSAEIAYIIATVNRYLRTPIARSDVRTVFAGLRPLVNRAAARTAQLSREHLVDVSASGLVTVTGGKWTTYRKMAQDAVDAACASAGLFAAACRTADLRLRDVPAVPEIGHAARHEMARTLEDVLARRTRRLFIDARAAIAQAPACAQLLAEALGRDASWSGDQVRRFEELALRYTTS
jgi:glycerol-3-phosphate dehydrogenase